MRQHVVTVPRDVPWWLKDALLASIEETLSLVGATRVWVEPGSDGGLAVLADVPEVHRSVATG
jgi:hypothetical protein